MSESNQFDLVVIGTGPSAGTVAKKTVENGRSVAVVESREYGGTCALRGCNPKKVYTNAGNLIDQARRANGKLGTFPEASIDWSKLLAFKREFTQPVLQKTEQSFQKLGIETIHGIAKFAGPTTIEVDGRQLEAKRIFIGTGARPVPLGINGEEHVTHSAEFFELSKMPDHVVFIGGGYISMEFAHVVARYGSEVTMIDHHSRPLKGFDPDLVDQLTRWSTGIGIQFICGSRVEAVSRGKNGTLQVVIGDDDGGHQTITTKLVVHGAGRVPNIDDLNLDAGDVQHSKQGVAVDEFMRSVTNPHVFASGDCADHAQPKLTPVANEQARVVVKNLFAESVDRKPDCGVVPRVVFTSPCLAAIGMSQSEAKQQGFDLDVRYQDTSTWGSVRKTGQDCAAYKILIDKKTDLLLGAHLLGPAAEEVINLFALAMKFNLTATNLKSTLFAYPTFGADVRRML
ncbi:MAG: NAD(P)/FAD-dependent oxidoreductase [Planctomycetaceae bacterium]